MKNTNRKPQIVNLKSAVGALAKLACGMRTLRLHPKFRWLSYVCPIIQNRSESRAHADARSSINPVIHKSINPPAGPPRLRLRKRRRVSVQPTENHER